MAHISVEALTSWRKTTELVTGLELLGNLRANLGPREREREKQEGAKI
jgi:hypothetical protein